MSLYWNVNKDQGFPLDSIMSQKQMQLKTTIKKIKVKFHWNAILVVSKFASVQNSMSDNHLTIKVNVLYIRI